MSKYSSDVQDWLVELHSRSGKYVHRQIRNLIDDTYFLLFSSDSEFRSLSYSIYPKAIKRVKELEGEGEMIYNFIRDEHRIRSEFTLEQQNIHITEDIDKWISATFKKYAVNIFAFCDEWCSYFYEKPNLWEKDRKKRIHQYDSLLEDRNYNLNSYMFWNYEYKDGGDRFGLNTLYRNMPKKDYTKRRKQAFDAVMMYLWTHSYVNGEEDWEEYRTQLEGKDY